MTGVTAKEARTNFADILNRASYGKERVALTRRGTTVAYVVPAEDVELLEKVEDYVDNQGADAALKEAEEKGTITLAELKKGLGI